MEDQLVVGWLSCVCARLQQPVSCVSSFIGACVLLAIIAARRVVVVQPDPVDANKQWIDHDDIGQRRGRTFGWCRYQRMWPCVLAHRAGC